MIVWPSPITGLRLASPSNVVSGRLQSSIEMVTSFWLVSPVALSVTFIVAVTGMISSLNLPDACAAAVRFCDSSEYSSCASRPML